MLFGNKYFKLDIVHIDICILPECFLQKVQSEHIRGEKALSSYGGKKAKGKKGELRKIKVKMKIKVLLYLCTGTSPRLSSKMLMDVTHNNSSSILQDDKSCHLELFPNRY